VREKLQRNVGGEKTFTLQKTPASFDAFLTLSLTNLQNNMFKTILTECSEENRLKI
jgi:hypothetical protein